MKFTRLVTEENAFELYADGHHGRYTFLHLCENHTIEVAGINISDLYVELWNKVEAEKADIEELSDLESYILSNTVTMDHFMTGYIEASDGDLFFITEEDLDELNKFRDNDVDTLYIDETLKAFFANPRKNMTTDILTLVGENTYKDTRGRFYTATYENDELTELTRN